MTAPTTPADINWEQYICRGVHCKCMQKHPDCPNWHTGDHACPLQPTPAGATEQDWLDKIGLNVKLDYDGRKWHLSEDTKADIRAHEAAAVLDGKIELMENIILWEEQWGDNPHASSMEANRNALAALTKQKAAMQQEETA